MTDSQVDADINEKLAALVDEYEDGGVGLLYENLAPLYDFIYTHHYDYDAQRNLLVSVAPEETTRVIEGACGSGHLLSLLEDDYEEVVGVDLHEQMLDRARLRTDDARLVEANLLDYEPDEEFDVAAILGNALVHFRGDQDPKRLFARVHDLLAPNGVFVCDFMEVATLVDGYTNTDTFESDAFRVERVVRSGLDDDDGRFTMNFEYTVTDKEREKSGHIEELITARAFDSEELIATAKEVGFREVGVWDELDHDGVLVARA